MKCRGRVEVVIRTDGFGQPGENLADIRWDRDGTHLRLSPCARDRQATAEGTLGLLLVFRDPAGERVVRYSAPFRCVLPLPAGPGAGVVARTVEAGPVHVEPAPGVGLVAALPLVVELTTAGDPPGAAPDGPPSRVAAVPLPVAGGETGPVPGGSPPPATLTVQWGDPGDTASRGRPVRSYRATADRPGRYYPVGGASRHGTPLARRGTEGGSV
ncbi:hypothetical protein [Caldinitratiruptor microaerophilus]|uniref:Uncharacterized protein n=1 Tax=Caldinitratiruptor microaerophilus TaxID=671077 RepID=A0AA35CLU7_9FIRM|nr:hypothetical protein [Caldinitratiruptor microaerophilus]BDG59696.1 hypothetical protein caldi_07860 [Caldinitratiruptor microaerophilus]